MHNVGSIAKPQIKNIPLKKNKKEKSQPPRELNGPMKIPVLSGIACVVYDLASFLPESHLIVSHSLLKHPFVSIGLLFRLKMIRLRKKKRS